MKRQKSKTDSPEPFAGKLVSGGNRHRKDAASWRQGCLRHQLYRRATLPGGIPETIGSVRDRWIVGLFFYSPLPNGSSVVTPLASACTADRNVDHALLAGDDVNLA